VFFEQGVVVASMAFDGFHESFHAAEDVFAHFFRVFLFSGVRHFDAELVHFPDEFFGRADAVLESALSDEDDGLDERAGGIAQQYPIHGKMDVGLHASGVGKNFIQTKGGLTVEEFLCTPAASETARFRS